MKKLIFALTCLFLAIPCRARIITVDDNGSADFDNIQAAINDSNDSDTIIVADGIYTGEGNRDIDYLSKAITLRSANGPKSCIIDCEGTYEDNHRGFYFHSGEGSNSVLDGFTITKGYIVTMCWGGAGIHIDNSSPTIRNCIITGNVAELDPYSLCFCYGGGIYFNGTTLTMTNCIINDNSVGEFGLGGGICCMSGSNTIIRNCIISNNAATTPYDTAGQGGGIYLDNYTSSLYMVNCTIAENSASSDGGGIYFEQYENLPSITIRNSILWDNSPNQISTYGTYKGLVSCCDVQGGWPGPGPGGKPPNMDENPLFADPANEDYHLKSQVGRWDPNQNEWVTDANTSSCIDLGATSSDWAAELWPHGKRINIGAFGGTPQASLSLSDAGNIADLNNDDKVNSGDLKLFTNEWQNEQLLLSEDFNRNGFVDFDDFAIFGLQWSYPFASEPGMTFHIDDCNMEAGLNWPAAAESNEPRFSVWVEGRYIHFEDMMIANCCPDELGLEMTVEDSIITIYETEYTPGGCYCICDYPVTATLGPFEDGTYTVEVYDNYGNSLGVVEVTIGESPEPGMTFQIGECGLFSAAEQASETRFTVTVDGLYVRFEDTMNANCCPDELGLEMTVEDNLITIYETEYTPDGCRCMCNYPINATLGPFEPGTYILEVYEDQGGFIGSTTVVINPPQ